MRKLGTMVTARRPPSLAELPPPPPGKTGWPWTESTAAASADGAALPSVTVVTPSYNQAGFLEETIRSVLLQGYPDLEYIVMDGGSSDGSVEIIRRYEPWIAHWTSGPDGGQSDAINRGWARASGQVLAWLNSDDTYLPGAVRSAVDRLRRSPQAVLVYGRSEVCDARGAAVGTSHGRPFDAGELLRGRCPVAQPSAFARAEAVRRVGALDTALHYAMDADLWLRLSEVGEILFEPRTWSRFRLHDASKTSEGRLRFELDTCDFVARALARGGVPVESSRPILARQLARVALAHLRIADTTGARAYAARALREDARIVLDRVARRQLIRSLLGWRVTAVLRTTRHFLRGSAVAPRPPRCKEAP